MENDQAILVNSLAFEYVYVANQRCQCGGYFAALSQQLRNTPSGPVDRINAGCQECGAERAFDFNISSFFGEFEEYARFHDTDDHFREAMEHQRAGRIDQAEQALRRVIDPQRGEPAFAWAHFHLAMVLLRQGETEEALAHLERAAAIQPLEPKIHQALGQVCRAQGRESAAEEYIGRAEELREQFATAEDEEGE